MPQTTDLLQLTSFQSPTAIDTELLSRVEQQSDPTYESYLISEQKTNNTASAILIDPDGVLARLLAAAVINKRLRRMLLANPSTAVAAGYQGETFNLSPAEQSVLLALKANTLSEFAKMLLQAIDEHNEQVVTCNAEI